MGSRSVEEEEEGGGKKGGGEKEEAAEKVLRNWAELPQDVLFVIFKKIGAIEILLNAQFVCRPWRNLSFDPAMWKVIDMTTLHGDNMGLDLEAMAMEAVNRSQGQLEVFWLENFGSDDLLRHIADRTSILKCLRLISANDTISDEGLTEMVGRLPQLEELDITSGSFTEKVCQNVGRACPHLKCLRLNAQGNRYDCYESDVEAYGIASSMPELRCLQLVGNKLTNKGLTQILDECIHLEYLDLRCCFRVNLNLDTELRAKCTRIKLRLPNDPTDDYEFIAECDWDDNFGDEDQSSPYGYSDIEMMYEDMYSDNSDVSEDACYLSE